MADHEITMFLQRIREGRDEEASAELWNHYFEKLLAVARRNIGSRTPAACDEEDLALSAMHSFFKAADSGRLARLENRDQLWKLLVTIVVRKAGHLRNREGAAKRGSGKVVTEAALENGSDDHPGLAGIPDDDLAAQLMVECRELMELLDDPQLQRIASMLMEGYTIDEIAEQLDVARVTIRRKKEVIQTIWAERLN